MSFYQNYHYLMFLIPNRSARVTKKIYHESFKRSIVASPSQWKQHKVVVAGFPMDRCNDHFYKLNKHFIDFSPIEMGDGICLVPNILTEHLTGYIVEKNSKKIMADPKYHSWNSQSINVKSNGKIFLVKVPHFEQTEEILINSINGPYDYAELDSHDRFGLIDDLKNQKKIIKLFLKESGIDVNLPAYHYLGQYPDTKNMIQKDYYGVSEYGYKDPYSEWLLGKNLAVSYEHYINYYIIGML